MRFTNEQMFLKQLTDGQLVFDTKEAVKTEREATSLVVKYFREIEARQLYLDFNCTSLFEFATKELGYCAGSAQNRVNAMKLVVAVPEAEKKIETGELSLTAASKVHSFFRAEHKANRSYSPEEKLKVVELCFSKSTREVDRELASRNPDFVKYESIKPVGKDRFEVKFTITDVLEDKIKKLKGLLAHSQPDMTTEDLLEKLVELGLEKFDPARRAERTLKRVAAKHNASSMEAETFHAHETETPTEETRYIPAEVRHEVWARNSGRGCEFQNHKSEHCGSHHALQIDHVLGYARGGTHDLRNLRVLCAKHNRLVWKQNLGRKVVRELTALYEAS